MAGRTVLTAAHVVAEAAVVIVRTMQKDKYVGTVNERFLGAVQGPAPDLALIEVPDLPFDLPPIPLARLDRDSSAAVSVSCHAFGYPWFAKVTSPRTIRNLAEAMGQIGVLAKVNVGLATMVLNNSPGHRLPDESGLDKSAWSGMSGGPVIAGDKLLAVVIEHPLREGQSSITVAPISLLDPDPRYPAWGPGVSDPPAWWKRLGVTGPDDLPLLPARTPDAPVPPEAELAPDAVDRLRAKLEKAGIPRPSRWTAPALARLAADATSPQIRELASALARAAEAKPMLTDLGIGDLRLSKLQVIYKREIGSWPRNGSADAMVVQAAEVEESERRRNALSGLGSLTKLVIGVAAELGVAPQGHAGLVSWIRSAGYQIADAQQRYEERLDPRQWLLLNLGGEPWQPAPTADPPWPTRIGWTYVERLGDGTTTEPVTESQSAAPNPEGLAEALMTIFHSIPRIHHLTVDLAMPTGLLNVGIERWPIFDTFDTPESIADRYQPRLRWSQRLLDLRYFSACKDRTTMSSWSTMPKPFADAVLTDEPTLRRWIADNKEHAWLIGRRPAGARTDPLRILLKAGYGFLVWFPEPGYSGDDHTIVRVVKKIPHAARRAAIPDELPGGPDHRMVIWDDPQGRGDDFRLPDPLPAEPIPS
ncbi:hypothetical protein Aab01nite_50260 [Paractinoplanes abujensis]|nr:hypothetical protein Aab01nite_50260 [Actinoplanes abujensis]